MAAAKRRLPEEMGFSCKLSPAFHFIYRCTFENGLTEHELDHVIVGRWNGTPNQTQHLPVPSGLEEADGLFV